MFMFIIQRTLWTTNTIEIIIIILQLIFIDLPIMFQPYFKFNLIIHLFVSIHPINCEKY